jgi:hypothetical protein
MSDLPGIFNIYFVSTMCLFSGYAKGLMVAGLWAYLMRGICRLLM